MEQGGVGRGNPRTRNPGIRGRVSSSVLLLDNLKSGGSFESVYGAYVCIH